MAEASSEMDKKVNLEEATEHVENLLGLEAKLIGTYPKARLHTLVEEWFEDNKNNAADTWWTIQAFKNKKYKKTCENHLVRLSGKTIGKIKQEIHNELSVGDSHSASSQAPVQWSKEDYWLLISIGGALIGSILCIFFAPQPEGIIIYVWVCIIFNFFRKM